MTTAIQLSERPAIEYPDSDGLPMAENTLQYEWIVTIKGGLDAIFFDDPNVFVAGDLLWYPVKGAPTIRRAPDAMVAFGRPKGYRGSYKQWEEDNIAPQVVFEVLSPGNSPVEMELKFQFYQQYGVFEYYVYDPDNGPLVNLAARSDRRYHGARNGAIRRSPASSVSIGRWPRQRTIFVPDGHAVLSFCRVGPEGES